MNRLARLFSLAALLITSLVVLTFLAFNSRNFSYVVSDGKVTITGFSGSSDELTIPSTLGGYPVTEIGKEAFKGCSSLTSVEIPASVTKISSWAFFGCSSLTSVEIPEGVTKIDRSAFADCSALTSVEIPSSVTKISGWAFLGCS